MALWMGALTLTHAQDSCSVYIQLVQGGNYLWAGTTSDNSGATFTFEWSNGTTSSSLPYTPSGVPYCVTATSSTGCVATSCYEAGNSCTGGINVYGDSLMMAYSQGVPPFAYAWSTGETTQSIWTVEPGSYCVSITDADGCEVVACEVIEGSPDCGVTVVGNSALGLSAMPVGVAPFSYVWTGGMTTQTIGAVPAGGEYCVSITDATGCVAVDCYADSMTTLWVSIAVTGNVLTAVPNVNVPVTYLWSTGETTSNITVSADGNYCVTVMGVGMVAFDCYYYSAGVGFFQLSGSVVTGSTGNPSSSNNGLVYLIKYDEVAGTLTAVDSTQFTTYDSSGVVEGYYNFYTNDIGPYLVKAALSPSAPGYAFHLPTYYGNVLFWDEATSIVLGDFVPNVANITMVVGENAGGPGFVGGLVSEGANLVGHDDEAEFGPGDPVVGATVVIMDLSGTAVAYAMTDANGHYSITNLPYGDYTICVDMMNKLHGCTEVNISANGANEVNFTTQEGSVVAGVEQSAVFGSASISPNPVNDVATLTFSARQAANVSIQLLDNQGRKVWVNQTGAVVGVNSFAIPMATLPSGLYLVSATDGVNQMTLKVVKN